MQISDACRVQVRADPEAHPQGEARHAAALRSQAAKDAGMYVRRSVYFGTIVNTKMITQNH